MSRETLQFFIFCLVFDNLMNVLPDYQRYYGWLCFTNNSKFKCLIFQVFLIINVINRMASSPQPFPIFQLARAEALGTRIKP